MISDGQHYLRCERCGEYVNSSEGGAHRCPPANEHWFTFVVIPKDWDHDPLSVSLFRCQGKTARAARKALAVTESARHPDDYNDAKDWLNDNQVLLSFSGALDALFFTK